MHLSRTDSLKITKLEPINHICLTSHLVVFLYTPRNIIGLQVFNFFISNPILRKKLKEEIEKTGYSRLNVGMVTCQAVYLSLAGRNTYKKTEELNKFCFLPPRSIKRK